MGVFQKQPTSSSPWAVANVQTNDDAAGPYRMTTTTAPDDEEYYCDDATLASTPSIRQTFEFGSKHTTIVRDCGEPTDIIFGEQTTSRSSRRKRKDEVLVLLKKTVKLLVLVCRFLKRKSSSNENHQDWYDGFDEMDIQPPTTAVLV